MTDKKLFSVDDCDNLTNKDIRELYKKYVNPAIERIFGSFYLGNELIERAEGVWIFTKNNEKILDVTGGIGVLNHGHNHPRILKARANYLNRKKMEIHKTIFSPYLGALSHNIAKLLPDDLDYSFFCNSGAEAVEGAMKIAYKYHDGKRKTILHSDISFHGKLLGSASITNSKEMHFQYPQIPNTDTFEYNNIDSVKQKINEYKLSSKESDIYALIVEPFSAQAVVGCDTDFLKELQKICNENDIVLIFDEVYTGWFKIGKMFNFMRHNVLPDVLTTSKSFGGGKASISAYVCRKHILEKACGNVLDATLHTSTYNGFGEECITAIEAINIMQEDNYEEKSLNIEKIVKSRCDRLMTQYSNQIQECRGCGAHHGIYIKKKSLFENFLKLLPTSMTKDENFVSKLIVAAITDWLFKKYKILVILERAEVALIFSPSLIITEKEIHYFFDSLENTLKEGIWKITRKFVTKQFSGHINPSFKDEL